MNVSKEQRDLALDESDLDLLEWGAIVYDTLVEAKEDPYKHGRGFGDEAMSKARALAARFHRGTVRAVSPRSFMQCLECGEEIDGRFAVPGPDVKIVVDGRTVDANLKPNDNAAVKTMAVVDPLSRHLDESLCAFFVLMRVHRARTTAGM